MSTNVSHLADNIKPVTRDNILCYDLTAGPALIDLMDPVNRPTVAPGDENDTTKDYWFGEYISLQAYGGDVFFFFAPDNAVIPIDGPSPGFGGRLGAAILAGQTVDQLLPFNPALQSTGGGPPPNPPPRRWLIAIKVAGAGTVYLTLWPSSTKAM